MDYKALLNDDQYKAVVDTEGAVQVFAGAGSGKTRVLTHRIAYLIEEKQVPPYNILAITFTNKAANEMKERVASLTGYNGVWVSTFHSLCARILRQDIIAIEGYNERFTIYTEQDSANLVARILKDMGIDSKEKRKYLSNISNAKNAGLSPEEFYRTVKFVNSDIVYEVYKKYEEQLKLNNALDFDDLLIKTVNLLAENKVILNKWQERFRYILVDEFQDTNSIQMLLVRMLANKYGNIFVVGDDDQSIYSWRGAEVKNMIDFKKYFAGCRVYKLEQNYRSTSNILNLANKIIAHNKTRVKKNLWTATSDGAKVVYRNVYSDKEEADYVLSEISGLMRHNGYRPNDIAILVRANSLTRNFEERMNMYGIAYKVYGGFKFYERKEIQDVIAYMRLISNPKDGEAFRRIINFPRRGIGETTLEKLSNVAYNMGVTPYEAIETLDSMSGINAPTIAKLKAFKELVDGIRSKGATEPVDKLLSIILDDAGVLEAYRTNEIEDMNRLENIEEFKSSIIEFVKANPGMLLDDYLQSVALISASDDDSGECVTIATVHSVKGLEYKVCFIVGCENNIFPSKSAIESGTIEEERRCMYVAVTRARERLYLTNATSRFRFGKYESNTVSDFLVEGGLVEIKKPQVSNNSNKIFGDLSTLLMQKTEPISKTSVSIQPNNVDKDITAFVIGAKVEHTRYGIGTILVRDGVNAKIEFGKLGVREFNLLLAPMKVVE